MDICVLSRGGFRLGKLVSILSNENKRMEVAFTHIHKRCAERYMTSSEMYTTRPSVGGATVGTCVYKTANIKGNALHVA